MIALARAGPIPGNLSSSSSEAELMSTRLLCCDPLVVLDGGMVLGAVVGRAVVVLGAVAAGPAGDFELGVVCAMAGAARSTPSPNAAKRRASLILILPR